MAKQILIDSSFGMVRTAIADNGELVDFYEESPDQGRSKGNIYRGVVKRVDAPIQAAFVKFAAGRDGFLPLRDASAGKTPKPGETVLIQVVKDEVGDKGAALTAKLSLSGRYLVYIPERDGEGGISSKITDEERAALKKVLGDLRIPDGASVILRTAASEKSAEALQEDLDKLIAAHRDIAEKFDAGGEPALLYREAPPVTRYLREYYSEDVARVWVNTHEAYEECSQFFGEYEPDSAHKVELSHDGPMLFQRMGLETEVEKLAQRRVGLKSGANIVIDQAEALVAIDVNSAKASGRGEEAKAPDGKEGKGKRGRGRDRRGGDLEETVFAVNKEAAAEIGKQLRLRDLGGIIIVDFIDMESEKHRRQVEDAMRKALAGDKAKVKVYDISPLGIMQISRQRLRKSGHQFTRPHCEACQGRGWHPSVSAGALSALRKLEERLHGKKSGPAMSVSVPYPVANKLMNEYREHLLALEKRHGCVLRVIATGAASGDPIIAVLGGGEAVNRNGEMPVREAQGRGQQAREGGREGRRSDGRGAEAVRQESPVGDASRPEAHGGESRQPEEGGVEGDAPKDREDEGRPLNGDGRQGQPRNGLEREGQPRIDREREGHPRNGLEREGQPWNGRGRDGQRRNGLEREGQPRIDREREGHPRNGLEREGQPWNGRGRDGQRRNGLERDGQPRNGGRREGHPRDGRGRDGQPRIGGEREAQAAEAAAREGRPQNGRDRGGRPWNGGEREAQAREAATREGRGSDGRNRDGRPPDGRGRDGRHRDGRGPDNRNGQGQTPRGHEDRGRDDRNREGQVHEGQPIEAPVGPAEAGAPGLPTRPEHPAQVPQAGDPGRDRERQGRREERGGRRRRGGRGRGRGRDGGQRDGRDDQGAVHDGAGNRPQGKSHTGMHSGPTMPRETAVANERPPVASPENRQPHEPGRTETRDPADAVAGRSNVVAPVPSGRENVAPAWDFSSKAEGAHGGSSARGADEPVAPRTRSPRARKEAKLPVVAVAKAPGKKKGPQQVRPGSGRPAPEPKPRSAKTETARPQGTRAQASPAAEVVKRVKAAKKRPAARAAKESGATPRAKGKV